MWLFNSVSKFILLISLHEGDLITEIKSLHAVYTNTELICSFNKYSLDNYYVVSTFQGLGYMELNKKIFASKPPTVY